MHEKMLLKENPDSATSPQKTSAGSSREGATHSASSTPQSQRRSWEAELAARESAAGTKVFEVNYGTKYVEVILASLATKRLAKRAYCISARR